MGTDEKPKYPAGCGIEEAIASHTGDVSELKKQIQEALKYADILYMELKYDSQNKQWEITYDEDDTEFCDDIAEVIAFMRAYAQAALDFKRLYDRYS